MLTQKGSLHTYVTDTYYHHTTAYRHREKLNYSYQRLKGVISHYTFE